MTGALDPYHRWLGIAPKHQPADHYRLLGLERFEDDLEVIRDAAERQMAHVRRYQLGEHSALSQTILNELAAARACFVGSPEESRIGPAAARRTGTAGATKPSGRCTTASAADDPRRLGAKT